MRPGDRSHRCTGPNLRDDRAPLQLPSPVTERLWHFSTERLWHSADQG
jgi:hypothetical protein